MEGVTFVVRALYIRIQLRFCMHKCFELVKCNTCGVNALQLAGSARHQLVRLSCLKKVQHMGFITHYVQLLDIM